MYSWASFDHEDNPNSLLCLLINITNFLNCLTGYIRYILLVLLSTTYLGNEVYRTICQAHTQVHIFRARLQPSIIENQLQEENHLNIREYHPSINTYTPAPLLHPQRQHPHMHQPNPSRGSNRIYPIPVYIFHMWK